MISLSDHLIKVSNDEEFRPRSVLECGQIFRYEESCGVFSVFSSDKAAVIAPTDGGYEIRTDAPSFFYSFFDFETDYEAARKKLSAFPELKEGLERGKGLRLLRQPHFETLIGFIVSANNNIPRIKGILRRLAAALGEDKGWYHAFPTPQEMAEKGETFYKELGAGYRAKYLAETARLVANGFDLDALEKLSTPDLLKSLLSLPGVGPKVADCVALFSYARWDVFPVDTWIKKVYEDVFRKTAPPAAMRRDFLALFGSLSGLAQQYLFFGKREE